MVMLPFAIRHLGVVRVLYRYKVINVEGVFYSGGVNTAGVKIHLQNFAVVYLDVEGDLDRRHIIFPVGQTDLQSNYEVTLLAEGILPQGKRVVV